MDNRTKKIPLYLLPQPQQASEAYRNMAGTLTDPAPFGMDPLEQDYSKKHLRMKAFCDRYPSFDTIFHELVNGSDDLFRQALLFFIEITKRMSLS